MQWYNINALFALLLIPLFVVFLHFAERRRLRRFAKFSDNKFHPFYYQQFSKFHWNMKQILLIFALFFLIIGLARPQWDQEIKIYTQEGIDIVVCLDVSKSMDAEDIRPSRIQRAKNHIAQFIGELSGDRVGLVAFAGESIVQSPLTNDYSAARLFLDLLDTNSISSLGTDMASGLKKSASLFHEDSRHKIIILVSDGEDLQGRGVKTAEELSEEGVTVYVLGIGTPQGSPIPIRDEASNLEYAKDQHGEIILTKLDVNTLAQIASVTGGKFYPITPHQSEIYEILKEIETYEKDLYETREYIRYKEQYHYFIIIAFILLLIESAVLYKKKSKFMRVI